MDGRTTGNSVKDSRSLIQWATSGLANEKRNSIQLVTGNHLQLDCPISVPLLQSRTGINRKTQE